MKKSLTEGLASHIITPKPGANATSFGPKLELAVDTYALASVLLLNLDNCKAVSDNVGHPAGDIAIRGALHPSTKYVG